MPGPEDWFSPGEWVDPAMQALNQTLGTTGQVLQNPAVGAGALQFGLNLMQPRGWGQTALGNFGSAIGSGAEAMSRQEAMGLKEREVGAKEDVAQARLDAARSSADAATGRSEIARERLGLAQDTLAVNKERYANQLRFAEKKWDDQLEQMERRLALAMGAEERKVAQAAVDAAKKQKEIELSDIRAKATVDRIDLGYRQEEGRVNRGGIRAQLAIDRLYQDEKKAIQTRNSKIDASFEPEATKARLRQPIPSKEEFIRGMSPAQQQLYLGGGGGTEDTTEPGAPGTPPAPGGTAPVSGAPMPMPSNKAELRDGATYQTPRGPARWNKAKDKFEAL